MARNTMMMPKALILFALLGLVAFASCSDVTKLHASNFDQMTKTGTWMVEFFAPWCGHCKSLAPVWAQLATEVKDEVSVAAVDCTENAELCGNRFGVRGYPTIKFIKDGKVYDFAGQRSIEGFKAFIAEGYQSAPSKPLSAGRTIVVGATPPPLDTQAILQLEPLDPNEKKKEKEKDAPVKKEDVNVVVLTDSDFVSKIATGGWFVKFYAPWCGHCKTLAPKWENLSARAAGQFNVAKIDCTTNRATCSAFGVRGYPTLKFIKDGKVYSYGGGDRTENPLLAFGLTGYASTEAADLPSLSESTTAAAEKNKKEVPATTAAAPPSGKEVIVLTTENFDEKIASGGDWLVEFYAPWCGHCKHLAPIWNELAGKVTQNIAKVDCTVEKSLQQRFDIKGFPTIKYITGGKVYDYKGQRTQDGFVKFMKSGYTSASSNPYVAATPKPAKKEKRDKDEL